MPEYKVQARLVIYAALPIKASSARRAEKLVKDMGDDDVFDRLKDAALRGGATLDDLEVVSVSDG